MEVLKVTDLYRFYHTEDEETLALKGVSFRLDSGEILTVQGPSGSGKSTLLACIAGLDEPDGGFVAVKGQRITRKPESIRTAFRARKIGIMMQSGNLFEHLTIEENIRMQMLLAGKNKNDIKKDIDALLEQTGLEHVRRSLPSRISGGEAARAGLAVAISPGPEILLADEPTGEVDSVTENNILRLFETYSEKGGAVLIVTHSKEVVSHASRTIFLYDGSIVKG